MPRAIPPFAKVLALFFVQGLVLWVLTYFQNDVLATFWIAGVATLVAWWALWLALHPERTWQPWLECLALAGAAYWVPIFCDGLLRDWLRPAERNYFFPPQLVSYWVVSIVAILTFPLALLLCGVRWTTGWRLQAATTARQVGLRGLFLLMMGVALHLAAFQPLLRELIDRNTWPNLNDLYFWVICLLFNAWVAIIVLGAAMLVLGQRLRKRSVLVIALGSAGLVVSIIVARSDLQTALLISVWALATIYVTAFGNAFALRAIGYRLTRRGSQPVESQPSEPLAS